MENERRRPFDTELRLQVIEEYKKGLNATQLSQKFNIHKTTVAEWIRIYFRNRKKFYQLCTRYQRHKGLEGIERDNDKNTVLYDQEFRSKIVQLFLNGKNIFDIEKEFGVAQSTISNWVHLYKEDKEKFNSLRKQYNQRALSSYMEDDQLSPEVPQENKNEIPELITIPCDINNDEITRLKKELQKSNDACDLLKKTLASVLSST